MTIEELSRVSKAMGIQCDLLCCFAIDTRVDEEACQPFCTDRGLLQAPRSL